MTTSFRAVTIPTADEMTPGCPYMYGATPIGVATSQVESLASFACRLGDRRNMRPATVVISSLQRFAERKDFQLRIQKQNGQINGAGLTAQRAIDAFDSALAVRSSAQLTFRPWTEIVEARMHGFLRPHIGFCPECINQDRLVHDGPYIRLLWMLKVVESCPIHNIRLYDACPTCGDRLPVIPWLTNPLFCMKCRQDISRKRCTYFQGRPTDFSQWISFELGKLLAATNGGGYSIGVGQMVETFQTILEKEFDGNVAEFARFFGLDKTASYKYFDGSCRPTFPALCRILFQLKLSPADLWVSRNNALEIDRRTRLRRTTTEVAKVRTMTPEKKVAIRQGLTKLLASEGEIIGPAEFAKQYDTSNMVVRYHFADLYAKHRARFHQQQKRQRALIRQERLDRVKQAARGLVEQGIYPSQRKLKQTGKVCANDLTRSDVRNVLSPIINAFEREQRKEIQ
ncbi:TniQ family protein [Eudoraea sp.]|uniref:TniQ family protein n=1 Tax=Eudoraea sp. TaxID=1979955 RepID=UPI003C781CC0